MTASGLVSPVIPHRLERLSQHPERYSPNLFFTNSSEQITYKEAMKDTDVASWQLAIESEMNSIMENENWDFVELPRNRIALLCKWVF
jgi:hypothetical protein